MRCVIPNQGVYIIHTDGVVTYVMKATISYHEVNWYSYVSIHHCWYCIVDKYIREPHPRHQDNPQPYHIDFHDSNICWSLDMKIDEVHTCATLKEK